VDSYISGVNFADSVFSIAEKTRTDILELKQYEKKF